MARNNSADPIEQRINASTAHHGKALHDNCARVQSVLVSAESRRPVGTILCPNSETKRFCKRKDRVPASHWGSHNIRSCRVTRRRARDRARSPTLEPTISDDDVLAKAYRLLAQLPVIECRSYVRRDRDTTCMAVIGTRRRAPVGGTRRVLRAWAGTKPRGPHQTGRRRAKSKDVVLSDVAWLGSQHTGCRRGSPGRP